MPLPPSVLDRLEALRPLKEEPDRAGLFLDLDGTLCELVDAPEDVVLPQATRSHLRDLAGRYGAVAIISGREAQALRRIVDLPSLVYVGNHGLEMVQDGTRRVLLPEAEAARMRQLASVLRDLEIPGAMLELKELSHAIHYRRAAQPRETRRQILDALDALELEGVRLTEGKMLVQIRPDYPLDKGKAVEVLVRERGLDRVLYAGDDTTDLDAFRTLSELQRSGDVLGFKVTVHHPDTPQDLLDQADYLAQGIGAVADLLRWLRE